MHTRTDHVGKMYKTEPGPGQATPGEIAAPLLHWKPGTARGSRQISNEVGLRFCSDFLFFRHDL